MLKASINFVLRMKCYQIRITGEYCLRRLVTSELVTSDQHAHVTMGVC